MRGQAGPLLTLRVGAGVRNFDQIRSGDRVTVTQFQAVAAQIVPTGAPRPRPNSWPYARNRVSAPRALWATRSGCG